MSTTTFIIYDEWGEVTKEQWERLESLQQKHNWQQQQQEDEEYEREARNSLGDQGS